MRGKGGRRVKSAGTLFAKITHYVCECEYCSPGTQRLLESDNVQNTFLNNIIYLYSLNLKYFGASVV